jgi:starch phosphorylase
MLRLLVDEFGVGWQLAWNTANHTFSAGVYNIKESQMEKWPVDLFAKILPRHYDILVSINEILID